MSIKYDNQNFNFAQLPVDSIDRYSLSFIPPKTRVLELGCATGFHSAYLKQEKNCQVVGVEMDLQAAKKARKHLHHLIVGNLDDEATWKKIKQLKKFDVVYASNVLEHLIDPWLVLQYIHQILKQQGTLVIALPNIAFWRSRVSLMRGIWQYQEFGIFDRTHTKFFTLNSARQALMEAGFEITNEGLDPAGGAKWLTPVLKRFPNAYAHQFAIQARKISR